MAIKSSGAIRWSSGGEHRGYRGARADLPPDRKPFDPIRSEVHSISDATLARSHTHLVGREQEGAREGRVVGFGPLGPA